MESIKEIFKIGKGPSSSHTMGPKKAAEMFRALVPGASSFFVTLYGSLAATGKGHLTDVAISEALGDNVEFDWRPKEFLPQHPNGMKFRALDSDGNLIDEQIYFSVGGGDISQSGKRDYQRNDIYPHTTMAQVLQWCNDRNCTFWEYVATFEESDIWDYLAQRWDVMQKAIERGLDEEGVLPGGLNVRRKAYSYYQHAKSYHTSMYRRGMMFAFALAVSEENAAGGTIVTAPTCGSCGVLPAALNLIKTSYDYSDKKILKAMATAGLIGSIIKQNASISGAEVGCQGEIGSACAMTSGAVTQLFGGSPQQIECAASIGMEHFLGLTCDPVCGLVQIPCIERNAFAAARVMDATQFSLMSDGRHIVPFDTVVEAMKQTGHDLPNLYKETSEGGLAFLVKNK
ncbi:MAG: L-serine ammonia-lyase [Bacteroidales bacterium]|nr:L-serine ammonia-lyase [Bacteroidales bacterium]